MVPSSRLLIFVAAVLAPAAILTAVPRLSPAGYIVMAGVVAVALADAAGSRRLLDGIALRSPELLRMWKGRPASIDLIIGKQQGGRRALRLGLLAPEDLVIAGEEIAAVLPAGPGSYAVTWNCTPRQRGRYRIESCALETPSRLGLWLVRGRAVVELEVRVYPDLASARKTASLFRRGIGGSRPQRQIGRGREFEKLRDYAPGDGFDEVDWKATARRGRPITRVFQVERTQEVYVVLDASRLSGRRIAPDEPDTILERNITAALLLAIAAEKEGDLFGLVAFSDRVHSFVRARNGKAHYSACREAIYTLQPRIVTPDFDEVCALLRLRLRRRALLVFLTELDDPVLAGSFVKNAGLLRRQHLVLTGMLRPPNAEPLFEGAPVLDSDEVYERLAGHEQWYKLRELAKVLERQGVHFVLFQPATLAAELASSYLNLKRRQLL